MTYAVVVELLQWAFRLLVIGLMGVVLFKILDGTVRTGGLLSTQGDGTVEPERLQALVTSIAVPGAYLSMSLPLLGGATIAHAMPEVPSWMLAVGASSQVLFLIGKVLRLVKGSKE
jgi:hypothetical protein